MPNEICQTCKFSSPLNPGDYAHGIVAPLFCRQPAIHPEKRFPLVWPVVEATFWCIRYKKKPTPSVDVTGTLSPDITGSFYYLYDYNSEPLYTKLDAPWLLWYNSDYEGWLLTHIHQAGQAGFWLRNDSSPFGEYSAIPNATGTLTVTEGVPI